MNSNGVSILVVGVLLICFRQDQLQSATEFCTHAFQPAPEQASRGSHCPKRSWAEEGRQSPGHPWTQSLKHSLDSLKRAIDLLEAGNNIGPRPFLLSLTLVTIAI